MAFDKEIKIDGLTALKGWRPDGFDYREAELSFTGISHRALYESLDELLAKALSYVHLNHPNFPEILMAFVMYLRLESLSDMPSGGSLVALAGASGEKTEIPNGEEIDKKNFISTLIAIKKDVSKNYFPASERYTQLENKHNQRMYTIFSELFEKNDEEIKHIAENKDERSKLVEDLKRKLREEFKGFQKDEVFSQIIFFLNATKNRIEGGSKKNRFYGVRYLDKANIAYLSVMPSLAAFPTLYEIVKTFMYWAGLPVKLVSKLFPSSAVTQLTDVIFERKASEKIKTQTEKLVVACFDMDADFVLKGFNHQKIEEKWKALEAHWEKQFKAIDNVLQGGRSSKKGSDLDSKDSDEKKGSDPDAKVLNEKEDMDLMFRTEESARENWEKFIRKNVIAFQQDGLISEKELLEMAGKVTYQQGVHSKDRVAYPGTKIVPQELRSEIDSKMEPEKRYAGTGPVFFINLDIFKKEYMNKLKEKFTEEAIKVFNKKGENVKNDKIKNMALQMYEAGLGKKPGQQFARLILDNGLITVMGVAISRNYINSAIEEIVSQYNGQKVKDEKDTKDKKDKKDEKDDRYIKVGEKEFYIKLKSAGSSDNKEKNFEIVFYDKAEKGKYIQDLPAFDVPPQAFHVFLASLSQKLEKLTGAQFAPPAAYHDGKPLQDDPFTPKDDMLKPKTIPIK